ncbi:hypothetical protein [Sphingosinicella sp. CPCC 101087]|uniref:CC0125/CC1285 family lipoprotein n=1 Tax=Sphingosinicella sp. CPCC 101087 TaxID=2497754 RepID=UPI00101B842F|nr:hypothetical protein [Sphingosinicella sp. CPCC 101087]
MDRIENSLRRPAFAAALATVLLAAACATPTPYQPIGSGHGAGGYAEQRIEANRFRVSFTGNSLTSRERVENYLLFRAAELTVEQGYDGFTVVQRETERDVDTRVVPVGPSPYHFWRPYWRWYGRPFGWRSWDPWLNDPFWANDVDVRQVERYEAFAEIVMFRGSRPGDPNSFDARRVMANLGPTIEVPR